MKKYISCLLVLLALVLPMLGMEAAAAETVDSGTCGENVTWTLDDAGILTISGTGDMESYEYESAPWYAKRAKIKSVVVEDGVTKIGAYAFYKCSRLESVTIPDSVTEIEQWVFHSCSNLTDVYITDLDAWLYIIFGFDHYGANPLRANSLEKRVYLEGELVTDLVIPAGFASIPESAFYYWSSLESVTIPDTVTEIGSYAFCGCSSLESVTIPDTVTEIGGWAFSGCSSLESIAIGDGVTEIGYYAFYECSSLKSITIPESVFYIDYDAFDGCDNLTDVYITDIAAWLDISFEGDTIDPCANPLCANDLEKKLYLDGELVTDLVIPNGVSEIGESAFENCSSLESVTIPDSVTKIGESAFEGCSSLESVTIPGSITEFGSSAFSGCSDLKSVTIGGGVAEISSGAFENCSSLKSVTIPDSVTVIGYSAFSGCSSLESVTIPDSITEIRSAAFSRCSSLESVTIPDSVTTISEYAFYGCSSLESVTIPDSVTEIGYSAFSGCSCLTDVYITDIAAWLNITFIFDQEYFDRRYGANPLLANELEKNLYLNEELITDLVIPDGVTEIVEYAFPYCSFESVTLPDSVTEIGDYAFKNCNSLVSITIPDSVTKIGEYAFSGCDNLTDVYITDIAAWLRVSLGNYAANPILVNDLEKKLYLDGELLTDLVIPDGVTEIGEYAFRGCSSLESVTIPDGVTKIGDGAFYGCSGLKGITIPGSVTKIGNYAFHCCSSLTDVYITDIAAWLRVSLGNYAANPMAVNDLEKKLCLDGELLTDLVIPDGVTEIGEYAFRGCSSLERVTIPDGVTKIGDSAFSYCSGLKSVTIGGGVAEIGIWAFADCSSLERITIPNSVTTIGRRAFQGCVSLESVFIPEGVTEIGVEAFSGCRNLQDVYYEGTSVQWESINYTPVYWRLHYECATADNHWTAITKPATCAAEGYTAESCACNYIRNKTAIPVEKHNYASVITPPTCTEAGYTTYTCTECGDAYTDDIQEKLGHDLKAWVVEKEATFQESGLECRYCRNCDYFESRDIPPKESKPNNPFVDVFKIDYYYAPVLWAVENGITNGLSENTFGPDATCTRGQIVTFLWRACGSPEPKMVFNPFSDVSSEDYFYDAVLWAVEKGITSGMGDGSFAPGAPCTRGQVATFLWRACGQPAPSGTNIFTDIAPGAYYYDAVLWAVENGITNGVGEGLFAPDAPCTRGQIVTFLYRAMQ